MHVIQGGVTPHAAATTNPLLSSATKAHPHLPSSFDGPSSKDPSL
jgi:hypothetical protein